MRQILIVFMLAWVASAPALATDLRTRTEPPAAKASIVHQVADVVIGRPVALVRLVVGVAVLPVTVPVGVLLWDLSWALDVSVVDPFSDLVRWPLDRP